MLDDHSYVVFDSVLEQRRMSVLKGFFFNIDPIITTIVYFPCCDYMLSSETQLLTSREPEPKCIIFFKCTENCYVGN